MPKRIHSKSTNSKPLWAGMPISDPAFQNDRANADRFVEMHRSRVRYCAEIRKWLVWDERRWVQDERILAMRLAKETAKAMLDNAAGLGSDAIRFAKTSNNRQSLENMLALASVHPDLAIQPEDLDSDPLLLNCSNGTLDLRTITFRDHDPRQLLTKFCPVEYDPSACSDVWERFLEGVVPDLESRQFLQRWFGYCLTGETREQVMLIFLGSGANGKSTLLDTIQFVLGQDYSIQGSPDLLVDKPRDTHPTNRMDLFGRRLVVCTETEQDQKLAESLLKQLTGSDVVRGRQMRQDNWQFRPTHKLILCSNYMPRLSGGDDALWRRIVVVVFNERFWNPDTDAPGPESHRQDKNLPRRLKEHASAILRWMVEGCREWLENGGLRIPESLRSVTAAQRTQLDVLKQFIAEKCETGDPNFKTAAKDLQDAFALYCQELGERVSQRHKTSERLQAMGFVLMKNSSNFYVGLRIKPAASTFLRDLKTLPKKKK